jgi:hypothetical protein
MKKHWRWILLLWPIVVLGGFLRWKTQQPEYVLRQFIEWDLSAQQSDLEEQLHTKNCAREHLEIWEAWHKKKVWPIGPTRMMFRGEDYVPAQPLLLWLSWYRNDQHTSEFDIDIKGVLGTFSDDYGDGKRGSEPIQLSQAELQRIRRLIKKFPSGVAPAPTFKDILFISYRDGDSWQARIYDRRTLPAPVRDLWKLISIRAKINSQLEKPDQITEFGQAFCYLDSSFGAGFICLPKRREFLPRLRRILARSSRISSALLESSSPRAIRR